jgi:hypothetical protein
VEGKTGGALPWGLLGALVAAIAIEAVIANHDLDLTRPENLDWR